MSHSVRCRPRGPAAGTWIRPAPLNAIATAFALPSPDATNHTSAAASSERKVNDVRNGGGFGELRTPMTAASCS